MSKNLLPEIVIDAKGGPIKLYFYLGIFEDFEEETGVDLSQMRISDIPLKHVITLLWIAAREEQPDITRDQVKRRVSVQGIAASLSDAIDALSRTFPVVGDLVDRAKAGIAELAKKGGAAPAAPVPPSSAGGGFTPSPGSALESLPSEPDA